MNGVFVYKWNNLGKIYNFIDDHNEESMKDVMLLDIENQLVKGLFSIYPNFNDCVLDVINEL